MRIVGTIAIVAFIGLFVYSHPLAAEESMVPIVPDFPIEQEITDVGTFCPLFCRHDPKIETQLETEFWAILGSTDTGAMKDWLQRAYYYSGGEKGFFYRGPMESLGRIRLLMAGGHVFVFSSFDYSQIVQEFYQLKNGYGSVFSLLYSVNQHGESLYWVLEAFSYALEADYLLPDHLNAGTMRWGLQAFLELALGLESQGKQHIFERLLPENPREDCRTAAACFEAAEQGNGLGTEGLVAAAITLGMMGPDKDGHYTEPYRSLELFGNCDDDNEPCAHTTGLAPYKKIGAKLTIAEVFGKLGDDSSMLRVLDDAERLATETGVNGILWPEEFWSRVDELENNLTEDNGILDKWRNQDFYVGNIQFPAPLSVGVTSCSNCHFGGKMTNPNLYFELWSK